MQFFAFLVFFRLSLAFLNISTFPPDFAKCEQVCLFFHPIRFFLKPDFTSSIVPQNISAICQKFCTFFPHYYLFFRIFLSEYCSLVVKVSFVLFFWKFCVSFEVNFMFEFPPFPNIMYVYVVHALRACQCKSKADLCPYTYIYKQLLKHFHGNTVIFY